MSDLGLFFGSLEKIPYFGTSERIGLNKGSHRNKEAGTQEKRPHAAGIMVSHYIT